MPDTVGDVLLNRLREWDVRQVFGYPGDGINGLLAAQAKSVVSAVLKGDEHAAGYIKQGMKQKAQQYLPGDRRS